MDLPEMHDAAPGDQLPSKAGGRIRRSAGCEGDLSRGLVRITGLLAAGLEEVDLLQRAVGICQDALGDRVTLSINAGSPSAPAALASTSTLAQGVDGAQLAHDQGPCVTAFDERRTVVSSDLRSDARWPDIAADPRTPAVGGAVAVPLTIGDELLGALNVYGAVAGTPDARLVESAELLAAAVAAVIHELAVRRELESTAAAMERALTSRAMIDQAKGIVMADRGCSAAEAFEHLVEVSSTQHVKLRDLARQLVEQRSSRVGVTDTRGR
jgi:transcriptional regulator with GAF, ATPase, and Fis domain